MNIFSIKLIACITMVFDHIKYGLPVTENFVTTYLGRISFPLFAFLITEGYVHTSNLKKYYQRLLIFGIIFQALLNLCVVVGLVPVTGVTLPFISYGGSSLLVSMGSIGIILNISRNN